MAVDLLNPLTVDDLAKIEEGIQQSEHVIEAAEKASRAGIDVSGFVAKAEETLHGLRQLKSVYFPNQ